MLSYEEIYKVVKETLSEKRFYHSECVMERCIEYAEIYGIDIEKAKIVGISHDIAKEIQISEYEDTAKKYDVKLDEIEKTHFPLVHSKIGAQIAKKDLGCTEDICEAIKWHTTGKTNMSLLEKILFIADATGKDRSFKNVDYLYQLAKTNIDKAIEELLKEEIRDLLDRNFPIHPNSIDALNFFILNK